MIAFIWRQVPWVAFCYFIFALSSMSHPPHIVQFPLSDKVHHAVLYFILSVLVFRGFRISRWDIIRDHYGVWAIGFCLLYGLSDEWHQSFVANRITDFWDWIADAVGTLIGGISYLAYRRRKERHL